MAAVGGTSYAYTLFLKLSERVNSKSFSSLAVEAGTFSSVMTARLQVCLHLIDHWLMLYRI